MIRIIDIQDAVKNVEKITGRKVLKIQITKPATVTAFLESKVANVTISGVLNFDHL
jgi:hypothetical protein